jgi:hypothetical protein
MNNDIEVEEYGSRSRCGDVRALLARGGVIDG